MSVCCVSVEVFAVFCVCLLNKELNEFLMLFTADKRAFVADCIVVTGCETGWGSGCCWFSGLSIGI